jgi:hypothetical protein
MLLLNKETEEFVHHVKSFNTKTKAAIVYEMIDGGKKIKLDDKNKPIFRRVIMPNCILINTKTKEIVK